MKTILYSIAFIILFCSLTSCTVEEMPNDSNIKNQNSISAKEGDIVPPPIIPNNPKP